MPGVGFGNTCIASVVELWDPTSGISTQRVPNRWLCLRILNQGNSSLNSNGDQFPILALWNLYSESAGTWNFEILVEDSDTGSPSLISVQIESLFTIFVQFRYVNFVWKTMRGKQKALLNEEDQGEVAYMDKMKKNWWPI